MSCRCQAANALIISNRQLICSDVHWPDVLLMHFLRSLTLIISFLFFSIFSSQLLKNRKPVKMRCKYCFNTEQTHCLFIEHLHHQRENEFERWLSSSFVCVCAEQIEGERREKREFVESSTSCFCYDLNIRTEINMPRASLFNRQSSTENERMNEPLFSLWFSTKSQFTCAQDEDEGVVVILRKRTKASAKSGDEKERKNKRRSFISTNTHLHLLLSSICFIFRCSFGFGFFLSFLH